MSKLFSQQQHLNFQEIVLISKKSFFSSNQRQSVKCASRLKNAVIFGIGSKVGRKVSNLEVKTRFYIEITVFMLFHQPQIQPHINGHFFEKSANMPRMCQNRLSVCQTCKAIKMIYRSNFFLQILAKKLLSWRSTSFFQ